MAVFFFAKTYLGASVVQSSPTVGVLSMNRGFIRDEVHEDRQVSVESSFVKSSLPDASNDVQKETTTYLSFLVFQVRHSSTVFHHLKVRIGQKSTNLRKCKSLTPFDDVEIASAGSSM
jgi:hypothetical protein